MASSIIKKQFSGLILISDDGWNLNSRDSNGTSSFHSFSLDYPKYAVYQKVKSVMENPDNGFLFFSFLFLRFPSKPYI